MNDVTSMKVKLRNSSLISNPKPSRMPVFAVGVAGVVFTAVMTYAGYIYGSKQAPERLISQWTEELGEQELELSSVETRVNANLDALTQRIGLLQAHVGRLDALGSRLVSMADLKGDEFDFSNTPGLGGAEDSLSVEGYGHEEITKALESMELTLLDREQQLEILSQRILNEKLQGKVSPKGFPVASGWVSSLYGYRTDPFTGKRQFHKGVDIAAPKGEIISSVASGIVKLAEKHPQYGLEVEVDHGNGYVTRYAHASTLLVKVGDVVKKGTPLATIGSTGRSTGPHVHFEVIKEGRNINPMSMLKKKG